MTALPFPYFKGPTTFLSHCWAGLHAAPNVGSLSPPGHSSLGWDSGSLSSGWRPACAFCPQGLVHLQPGVLARSPAPVCICFSHGGVSPSGPRRGPFAPSSQGSLSLPGLTTSYRVSGNVCVLQQLGNFDGHITCLCRGRVYCLLMGQVVGSRHVGRPHIMPRKPLFEGAVASVRLRGTDKEQR